MHWEWEHLTSAAKTFTQDTLLTYKYTVVAWFLLRKQKMPGEDLPVFCVHFTLRMNGLFNAKSWPFERQLQVTATASDRIGQELGDRINVGAC